MRIVEVSDLSVPHALRRAVFIDEQGFVQGRFEGLRAEPEGLQRIACSVGALAQDCEHNVVRTDVVPAGPEGFVATDVKNLYKIV